MRVVIQTAGEPNNDIDVWGAQAVTGARTATTNIPYCRSTGASATTCGAEAATVIVSEFPWLSGAVSIDTRPFWNALSDSFSSNQLTWFDGRVGANNRRALVFVVSDDNTYFTNTSSGGSTTNINAAITWAQGTSNTLYAAWGSGNRSFGQNQTIR